MLTRLISFAFLPLLIVTAAQPATAGRCNHPDDLDAAGRRCGARAASERPGGSDGSYAPSPSYTTPNRSYSQPDYSRSSESSIPGWVFLTAEDALAQINVRTSASVSASAPHYGVVGDRVWASRMTQSEGYLWYFVGFPETKVSGWVRGDLVRVP